MSTDSNTLTATTNIQKWWKNILMTVNRCRKSQCNKLTPYAKTDGQLCEDCYAERYHPEYGWDNEDYKWDI